MKDVAVQFRGIDRGASDTIKKLRQESRQYSSESNKDKESSARVSKEVVRLLNQEIESLEKKLKLKREIATLEGGGRGGVGGGGPLAAAGKGDTNSETIQIGLLREVVNHLRDLNKKFGGGGGGSTPPPGDEGPPPTPEELAEGGGIPKRGKGGIGGAMMKGLGAGIALALLSRVTSIIGQRMTVDATARTQSEARLDKKEMLQGLIPILGPLLAARTAEEKRELKENWRHQRALLGAASVLGGAPMELVNQDLETLHRLGNTAGSRLGVIKQLAERGFAGSNIAGEATDIIAAGRAYGIDQSTMLNIARTGGVSAGGAVRGLLQIIRGASSDSGVGVGLQTLAALTQQMSQKLNSVPDLGGVVSAFQSVGGAFGDTRAGGTLSRMNAAIQSPTDDYNKAFLFSALSDLFPGESWGGLMMKQEEGISNLGVVNAILERTKDVHGFGDVGRLSLSKMLGLSLSEADKLMTTYEEEGEIKARSLREATPEALRQRGIKYTSSEDVEEAQTSDKFVRGLGMMPLTSEELKKIFNELVEGNRSIPVTIVATSENVALKRELEARNSEEIRRAAAAAPLSMEDFQQLSK